MNLSAVILAGGKSSRMGRDKAWLEVGGKTLLARQIQLAREVGAAEIFISGRAELDYSAFGCGVLRDKYAGAGPLAGIERALAVTAAPLLLVLAVDLPELTTELLQRLGGTCTENCGVIPRLNGHVEPLAAIYPRAAQFLGEALLRAGENTVAKFGSDCVQAGLARFVDLPLSEEKYFTNWNSPADLAAAPTRCPA